MIVGENLEFLTEAQCFGLLGAGEVGRVGVTMGALPAIFPVDYRVVDGDIVFRATPWSKLVAAVDDAVVAFEVDEYRLAERTGWSVLAVGTSEVVRNAEVASRLEKQLEPVEDGRRSALIRIHPSFVSGRRIVHGEPGTIR